MPTGVGKFNLKHLQILNDHHRLYQNAHNRHCYCPLDQVTDAKPTIRIGSKIIGTLVKEGYAKRVGTAVFNTGKPCLASPVPAPEPEPSALDGWDDLTHQDRLDLAHDVRHGPTVLSSEDLKQVYDWVWDMHTELIQRIETMIHEYSESLK